MARPSKEFSMPWASLAGANVASGWRVIAVDAAGPVRIEAGRRFPGNEEAVLFRFPGVGLPNAEALPNGQGFAVGHADPRDDGTDWLSLSRTSDGSPELFASMACDVAGALDISVGQGDDVHRLLRVFLGRVRAWQEFMRKGALPLSSEAEVGLIGELSTLTAIVAAGVPAGLAAKSWGGPAGELQDFKIGYGALETKTTMSAIGFPARVGSLEQLDDKDRQPLYVVGVKLTQLSSGLDLPGFAAQAKAAVSHDPEASRLVSERLVEAGLFDSDAGRYVRRFALAGMRAYEVTASFPRLTHGTVPEGVNRAIYDIDLEKAGVPAVDLATALIKMGAL